MAAERDHARSPTAGRAAGATVTTTTAATARTTSADDARDDDLRGDPLERRQGEDDDGQDDQPREQHGREPVALPEPEQPVIPADRAGQDDQRELGDVVPRRLADPDHEQDERDPAEHRHERVDAGLGDPPAVADELGHEQERARARRRTPAGPSRAS